MGEGPETMPVTSDGRGAVTSDGLLVHVHISRTGGSTLNHILRSSYGARHCPAEPWDSKWGDDPFTKDDLRKLRKIYPSLRSIAGHRLFGYVDLDDAGVDASYFAMVRDPVRACASRFQFKVQYGDKTVEELESWLQKDWIRNRHVKAIAGSDEADDAIRVIREKQIFMGLTERYDESVVLLKNLVAPDLDISYEPVNVASERSISREILSDDRLRGMIEEAQSADTKLYRYVKDVLWPEYVAAYGGGLEEDVKVFAKDRGKFNNLNILKSRLKAHTIYKPALYLHRRRIDS
jgi:hypothetical protein